MIIDERLERLYRQVELVKGAGDPRTGKLCVMSFVVYLAGEGHSDRPATASPLIRELAVRINDAMPITMRQELKPFVPRIIGTNDGRDGERAALLRNVTEKEILPRICADFLARGCLRGWRRTTEFRELSSRLFDLTHARDADADGPARCKLAAAVASLLCFCAIEAPDAASRPCTGGRRSSCSTASAMWAARTHRPPSTRRASEGSRRRSAAASACAGRKR